MAMKPVYNKDLALNIKLANDVKYQTDQKKTTIELEFCKALYRKFPDAIDEKDFVVLVPTGVSLINISRHVKTLEQRGIIRIDVMGKTTLYTLTRDFYNVLASMPRV